MADEAVYLVAVRAKIDPSGAKHTATMTAIEQALSQNLALKDAEVGTTVTLYNALTANHNGYLREFGFDFDTANRIITVAGVSAMG